MAGKTMAQPFSSIDLDKLKPAKYVNRRLISEKSNETNFKTVKHFFQNTFTHYNYFFNANNKVIGVLDKAKLQNKDDYSKLLTFYNYSFDNTAKETADIDSIIYKCTAGILLHDLRDDWVDNMYMLMGKAYLLKKNFDSAGYVFQYVNYAWAPKDDGYDIPIGSNISNNNGLFTVSTVEKKNRLSKLLTTPPSRNESLIWKVRTYLEQDRISNANGLIEILREDPIFPSRLQAPLHEMLAYSYYKQQVWDSAAWHLTRALPDADGALELARWEYLIGQMYQLSKGHDSLAANYFEKSIKHTTDPLMEVFARLNLVSLNSNKKGYTLRDNVNELYHLGRKDKFANYRDIIYYVAALLELQQNNKKTAIVDLQKSLKNCTSDNPLQRQKSLLLLADTYFDNKEYKPSYNYYDSIQIAGLTSEEKARVLDRRPALKIITEDLTTINLQDSLQRIANMSEDERKALLKKVLKQLRKEQGLKDADYVDYGSDNPISSSTQSPALFGNIGSGEFYFNNSTLIITGGKEFKSKWGNRPNTDNWNRQEAITKPAIQPATPDASPGDMDMSVTSDIDVPPPAAGSLVKPETSKQEKDLTYEGLMRDVPLRPEQKLKSDTSIARALFNNGVTFQNNLRDFPSAIDAYEEFLRRFPNHKKAEQAHYNLIYCYDQVGAGSKSDSISRYLRANFPTGLFTAKMLEGHQKEIVQSDTTKDYQNIYNAFADAHYADAKEAKLDADKKYGRSYWTPQLLYIESVDHILKREDTTAINRLQDIVDNFPKAPLAEKAQRMIDLLRLRLKFIQDSITARKNELGRLDSLAHINVDSIRRAHTADSLNRLKYADSIRNAHSQDSLNKYNYSQALRKQHLADSLKLAMGGDAFRKAHIADSLNKARLAESLRNKHLQDSLNKARLADARWKAHLEDSLNKARLADARWKAHIQDSINKARLAESLRNKHIQDSLNKAGLTGAKWKAHLEDSLNKARLAEQLRNKHLADSLSKAGLAEALRKKQLADSLARHNRADRMKKAQNIDDSSFVFDPYESHYAALELDDVIKVFINTATTAFSNYNKFSLNKENIDIASNQITSRYSFVYFGPFDNAAKAIDYLNRIKPNVSKTIVPWLPKTRYRYTIISESNLILLQQNKKVELYNSFLHKALPSKF